MQVDAKTEVDIIKFLKVVIEGIETDHGFVYASGYFNGDRAHTSLQSINGRVRSLKAFVNAVKTEELPKNEN